MSNDVQNKQEKSFPALKGEYPVYKTAAGDTVRVISKFSGERTASEIIHKAAIKKILYDAGRS